MSREIDWFDSATKEGPGNINIEKVLAEISYIIHMDESERLSMGISDQDVNEAKLIINGLVHKTISNGSNGNRTGLEASTSSNSRETQDYSPIDFEDQDAALV